MQFRYWYISLSYSFFGTLRPSLTYNAMETSFSWVLEILNQVSLWRVAVTETEMRALKFVFCHFKFVSVNTNLIHPCFFSVGCHYFSVFYVSKLLFWGLCFEISVVPLKKKTRRWYLFRLAFHQRTLHQCDRSEHLLRMRQESWRSLTQCPSGRRLSGPDPC